MWLLQFRELFPKAAKQYKGLDLKAVEEKLSQARRLFTINKSTLEALEENTDYWPYGHWWRELSSCLEEGENIQVPPNVLSSTTNQERIVQSLHRRFKSIEGVSVLLRFLYPEEFGILSFPVIHLINLAPSRRPVRYYLEYLQVLRGFRDNPKYRSDELRRVADIDMALWSAAHFAEDRNLKPEIVHLTEEMYRDEYFQEVRFENILKGFSTYTGKLTDSQYLVFATTLLDHDHRIAVAVAARPYDTLIIELAKEFRISRFDDSGKIKRTGTLIGELCQYQERKEFKRLGVSCFDLLNLWKWRSEGIHDVPFPIRKEEAEKFVRTVRQLLQKLG